MSRPQEETEHSVLLTGQLPHLSRHEVVWLLPAEEIYPDGDKEGGDDNQGHYPRQAASDDDKIEVLLQKSFSLPLLSRVSCVLVTV